jgi:NAD(P)-dependent dehydrogenase (short-subunit alcohol dehydrogenase family)
MGRRVVITGGSSGIGLEAARLFVEAGDEVIICSSDAEKLARANEELPEARAHVLDVADQKAVEALFEAVGPVDVLVANAGVCLQAGLEDADSDEVWRRTMDVNLNGVYYCLKAAQGQMPAGGAMVTVSSGLGKNARARYEAYTASKHAVLGLTKCVALELARRDIRVNAVCPGWVDTPMSRADAATSARHAGMDEDSFRRQAIEAIPMGRMVTPEEVARLIFFLCSPAASAITAQAYNISCGEFSN